MFRSLRSKFLFLLLGVAAVALSGTMVLRGLMVRDFRAYLEGEAEDRVYLVQAGIEGAYERNSGWREDLQAQQAIQALGLGLEMRLMDQEGRLVVDTQKAFEGASPLVQKRLRALGQFREAGGVGPFVPYPLFIGGRHIGTLEVRELRPLRENVFLGRSDQFLLLSVVIVGGLAILLSILFSRHLTRPLEELVHAASAISKGDLKKRVNVSRHDEVGDLSETFNRMAGTLETHEALRRKVIANVAHELRTPLGVMRGELEGMIDGLIPGDAEHLQSLYDETGRLKNIVSGIEDLNQAEASILSLKCQRVEIKPFLESIVERLGRQFQEQGVSLGLECSHEYRLYADPERLSQIILNLLGNALKATGKGGQVMLKVEPGGEELAITVKDNGTGIAESDLPFIFERFYRGPGGGLGIGLAIVKELAEAHGARIETTSTPGKGSSFAIFFPNRGIHNSS